MCVYICIYVNVYQTLYKVEKQPGTVGSSVFTTEVNATPPAMVHLADGVVRHFAETVKCQGNPQEGGEVGNNYEDFALAVYCYNCEMWLSSPTHFENHKIRKKHKKNNQKQVAPQQPQQNENGGGAGDAVG